MYNGPVGTRGMDQDAMVDDPPIAVFNDEFRDMIKGGGMNEYHRAWLHGEVPDTLAMAGVLRGKPGQRFTVKHPWNSVNYLECHDGLTVHDNLAFNLKLNPNDSQNRREIMERSALGLFLLVFSPGLCFVHAGQEFARSKLLPLTLVLGDSEAIYASHEALGGFVRNSYRSGDEVNAWQWNLDAEQECLRGWTANAIRIRRTLAHFWALDAESLEQAFVWYPQTGLGLAWSLEYQGTMVFLAANSANQAHSVTMSELLQIELRRVDVARGFLHMIWSGPAGWSGDGQVTTLGWQETGLELPPRSSMLLAWVRKESV